MGFKDKIRAVGNFVTFGAIDKHEAKKITRNSKYREDAAREELEEQKERTQKALEILGEKKADIYTSTLSDFTSAYEIIGKVSLKPIKSNNNLIEYKQYQMDLIEMRKVSSNLKEVAITAAGGALGSAVAVGGAMGLATLIGTASTGTAIGTLSGAAATNATLAWLGGGALSAGGAGMAGGILVLGGVALVPIAVFTMFMGTQKGKQKLNAAKDYQDQVDVLVEKIKTLVAELYQVQRGVKLVGSTIVSLDELLKLKLEDMNMVISRLENRPLYQKVFIDPIKKIFNIDLFTEEETQIILETTNCASLLKQIIDMPLLNEQGGFLAEAFSFLEDKNDSINRMLSNVELPAIEEAVLV